MNQEKEKYCCPECKSWLGMYIPKTAIAVDIFPYCKTCKCNVQLNIEPKEVPKK